MPRRRQLTGPGSIPGPFRFQRRTAHRLPLWGSHPGQKPVARPDNLPAGGCPLQFCHLPFAMPTGPHAGPDPRQGARPPGPPPVFPEYVGATPTPPAKGTPSAHSYIAALAFHASRPIRLRMGSHALQSSKAMPFVQHEGMQQMQLHEFIRQTLIQITLGVNAAASLTSQYSGRINPKLPPNSGSIDKGIAIADDRLVTMIQFDVAVTVTEGTGTKGGIGIMAGMVSLGSTGQSDKSQTAVNRIQFSVPIVLPFSSRHGE